MASKDSLSKLELIEAIEKLEKQLKEMDNERINIRPKIDQMSSEVVDSNPYSRLMALQRMGIVDNYADIKNKTVIVVGVGGVGSVSSEMLVRCGIGKLILFDYDKVELANMNRLFFQPNQSGLSKVEAAKQTLGFINPDVKIEAYNYNITLTENFEHFIKTISLGDQNNNGPVDLVLSCVDNFEARMSINKACNELNQIWIESGVSENAVSGHIQLMCPGKTPCFECLPPLIVASGIDERTLKREGVCAASLPTTMAVIAAFLVQNSLKFMLKFGEVSEYLGYGAMQDNFYKVGLKPNPECNDRYCVIRQKEYKENHNKIQLNFINNDEEKAKDVVHEENEFEIELIDDFDTEKVEQNQTKLNDGISMAYDPSAKVGDNNEEFVSDNADVSLDELMKQMKGL